MSYALGKFYTESAADRPWILATPRHRPLGITILEP